MDSENKVSHHIFGGFSLVDCEIAAGVVIMFCAFKLNIELDSEKKRSNLLMIINLGIV